VSPRTTIRRSDLLLTVSEELADLGASTVAIQATLGEILQSAAGSGESGLWHMQEIDRLQQMLDDLSAVLRAAAASDGPRVEVEELVSVARLGSLRDRLRGVTGDQDAAQDAGNVAIF
jgi:hypothetical protein